MRPWASLTAVGHDDDVAAVAAAAPLMRAGLLCNDAHLRAADEQWVVDGDPDGGGAGRARR